MRKLTKPEREVLVEGYLHTQKKANARISRSLHYSTVEGALTSVSNSVTTTYATPFALALGATNAEIGLLSSVKSLAETFAQVPGALLTQYMSRKSVWLLSRILSRAFWIPVILLPFFAFQNAVAFLILLLGLITFFASLDGPAWASLIGDIVPDNIRGRYLGRRNMVAGISGLAATLIAGSFLSLLGFPLIFSIAAMFSIVAIVFFVKIYEPPAKTIFHYKHEMSIRPGELLTGFRINRNLVMFTAFLAALNFSVYIAAPFFAVYMLKNLNISYEVFAMLVAFEALVAIVCQPYWGKLGDRYGERSIMIITGIMACFVPFIWLYVYSPWHIALANLFSAFAWSGFELVTFNFLLAVTPSEKRPQYIANHRLVKGLAVVAGALLGALLAQNLESALVFGFFGLQIIFLVSFVLRLASLVFLAFVKEADAREHEIVPVRYVFWRAVAVEPAHGFRHAAEYTFHYPYELAKLKEKVKRNIKKTSLS